MVFLDCERLLHSIDEHAHTYLEGWQHIHAQLSQTQPLQSVPALYEQLLLLLQRRRLHTTLLENEPFIIYGELDSDAAHTLLFYNRFSTDQPGIWELLPIAVRLMVLDAYQEYFGGLPINIKWVLHTSEKPDTSHLRSIVEKQRLQLQADGCLGEAAFTPEEYVLLPITGEIPLLFSGTKGLLCVELTSRTTTTPLPSHYGSIVPNAAWRLLWALNSLKDPREEITIEGFYDSLESPEDDALASLYTLPDTASAFARQWKMSDLLLGLQGFQMHYAHLLTPTCTVNFLEGGSTTDSASSFPSQIPSQARAQVDFYLVPGQEPDDIFARLQRHLHNKGFSDIEARLLYRCPPAYTPFSHAFAQLVRDATTQAYGRAPLLLPLRPESSPLALLQQSTGMPILITSSGNSPIPLQQWHHPDVIASLTRGLKQIALIILALSNI